MNQRTLAVLYWEIKNIESNYKCFSVSALNQGLKKCVSDICDLFSNRIE